MFSFVWLDIVSIKWILAECPFYGFIPHHNRLGLLPLAKSVSTRE